MGEFGLNGRELRKKGINRIGNLLVPNKNYCTFEAFLTPVINEMHDEQDKAWSDAIRSGLDSVPRDLFWPPSKVIPHLGKKINHPVSVLYWAAQNDIPIFCPALTDGSMGDMLYFHSYKRPGFILDINEDIRWLNDLAVRSPCTGQIIIGGGL
jgi:deoxyhypusine synthase